VFTEGSASVAHSVCGVCVSNHALGTHMCVCGACSLCMCVLASCGKGDVVDRLSCAAGPGSVYSSPHRQEWPIHEAALRLLWDVCVRRQQQPVAAHSALIDACSFNLL